MKPLKTLIVEDSETDEKLLLRQLNIDGYDVQSIRVQTEADMKKALAERDWDIILSDYAMPGFTGLDALRVLKESGRDIPLIIISRTIGEELAVEAMRVGVDDYLIKGNLARLTPAIERELENAASRRAQKLMEESLRRTEENLASAQRIAHIGSWETDMVNNRMFWSDEVYRIFGLSKDDFGATLESFVNFIHPEDRLSVKAAADAAMSGNAPFNVEHRIIRPNGEIRVVCAIGEVVFDESGKPVRFIGTVQDITERNAAETEMRLMKSAVDSIVEGVVISDPQKPDNPIIYTNAAFENLTGYAFDEIKGQNCRFLQGAETNPRAVDEIREALEKATTFRGEILNYRKNGDSFWNELKISPVFDRSGRLINFVGIQQDISERERIEAEKAQLTAQIERQNERLNNIVANVPGVVWEAWGKPDAATQRIDFVSDYVETLLGYTVEEWITTPNFWLSIVHPEDKERIARETAEKFHAGEGYTKQFRWVAKDGRIVCVESQATVIRDESGQPSGLRGINIDITERRRLEKERTGLIAELDTEKRRLQHIFDNSPSFIVSMRGPEFVFEMANPAYYRLVGKRDLIGLPAVEAIPEIITQGLPEIIDRVYNTGEPFVGNEVPLKLQVPGDSILKQHYINFVYMPLREADNSVSGVVSYGMDVTEQVLSRFKIQESEERYRFLFRNNPLPMWVFDVETLRFLSVNEAAIQHYGYSQEEFLNMNLKDIRPPEDIAALLEHTNKPFPGIDKAGVFRHRNKNGIIIDEEIISKQLIFNGKNAELVLANDVTERRKAEESVRFQAHLLNTVEQSVIATDLNGNVTYWNQFAEKLYGWTNSEAIGRKAKDLTAPEINLKQSNQITVQLSAGKSWAGELVVQNKAGIHFSVYAGTSPVNDDTGKIIGTVEVSVDITERKNAETALRQAEDKYRSMVESSPAIVYLSEPHPPFAPIYVSPNITRFGYPVEEWLNRPDMWISIIHEEDRARVLRTIEEAIERESETELEYRIVISDGTIIWLHDKGRFVFDERGNKTGWQGVMLDITKTKQLEEQLRQSQKLESVGLLAGGIAHDFNNMLTAINGYSGLTLRKLAADDPLRHNIEEIKKAGQRSADLTHQLLAFSRQQLLKPVIVNINEIIGETGKMLQRLLGEDIQLTTTLNPKAGRIKADPGQLSQIIMNLAVNARDAMPQGGKLTIETNNVFVEPDYASRHAGVLPGAYVILAVSDNGTGMNDQTKEHIFDPFFTTKEVGQGTGLGLATVYGIVKQSGGSIEVYSEEGIGTTFKIYLPRVADQAAPEKIKELIGELPRGTEKILLVEDEELVRRLSRQILEECGYTVIETQNGLQALEICERKQYKFDLLMTDVVMPQMGGPELAERLKSKSPDIKVLFTSGYTDDAVVRHGVIEADTNFIQKPFSPDKLAEKVREILDGL